MSSNINTAVVSNQQTSPDLYAYAKQQSIESDQFVRNLNSSISQLNSNKSNEIKQIEKDETKSNNDDNNAIPNQAEQVPVKENTVQKTGSSTTSEQKDTDTNKANSQIQKQDSTNVVSKNSADNIDNGEIKTENQQILSNNIRQTTNSHQTNIFGTKKSVSSKDNELFYSLKYSDNTEEMKSELKDKTKLSSLNLDYSKDLTSLYISSSFDVKKSKSPEEDTTKQESKIIQKIEPPVIANTPKLELETKSNNNKNSNVFEQVQNQVAVNKEEEKIVTSANKFDINLNLAKPVATTTNNVQTSTFYDVRLSDINQRTMQLINNSQESTTSIARLILKPQSLGTIFVEISVTDSIAKLNLKADSKEVAKTLESQLDLLKDKLYQNGIKVESVNIEHKQTDNEFHNLSYYQNYQNQKEDKKSRKDVYRFIDKLKTFDLKEELTAIDGLTEQGRS